MWARWPCWDLDSLSATWVQYICLLIGWTRPECLVLCYAVNDSSPTWRWPSRGWGQFGLESIIDHELHQARMPNAPAKKPSLYLKVSPCLAKNIMLAVLFGRCKTAMSFWKDWKTCFKATNSTSLLKEPWHLHPKEWFHTKKWYIYIYIYIYI